MLLKLLKKACTFSVVLPANVLMAEKLTDICSLPPFSSPGAGGETKFSWF